MNRKTDIVWKTKIYFYIKHNMFLSKLWCFISQIKYINKLRFLQNKKNPVFQRKTIRINWSNKFKDTMFTVVVEASRGAQSVTAKSTGCGFDPCLRRRNIYFHFFALASRQTAALSSTTQLAKPPELGGKLKARKLPNLLYTGYSVKLKFYK